METEEQKKVWFEGILEVGGHSKALDAIVRDAC